MVYQLILLFNYEVDCDMISFAVLNLFNIWFSLKFFCRISYFLA